MNISRFVAGFDIIDDNKDNLPAKYVPNKAAIESSVLSFLTGKEKE